MGMPSACTLAISQTWGSSFTKSLLKSEVKISASSEDVHVLNC